MSVKWNDHFLAQSIKRFYTQNLSKIKGCVENEVVEVFFGVVFACFMLWWRAHF